MTSALCQALILKKQVSAERFSLPDYAEPMDCPADCHACCRRGVTLDLTSVEALVIYLLNRGVVELVEEYTNLHGENGYCPFLIMDRCRIHHYKPTACQMYMPFAYHGAPICYYLAQEEQLSPRGEVREPSHNSHAYDIHGYMMKMQCQVDRYLSCSFFKNIYDGILWWECHYHSLPKATVRCLESILSEEPSGQKIMLDFDLRAALAEGHDRYEMLHAHP
ncbi:YkgJ family cysteine cluster protein [Desulfogranum mediterraneum]|uniref:YkgJ family cysteine cluster protein n=1 Tax=Desulfogranum mediterraneum TaxID=160661 RepID=UPI0003F974CB|nr:YkgJ family cysteine cluster protein [Desulfogranum mediterraneum]